MTIQRLIHRDTEQPEKPEHVPLLEWLEYLEHRRAVIMMELRQIEPILIRYGKLREETPRRVR